MIEDLVEYLTAGVQPGNSVTLARLKPDFVNLLTAAQLVGHSIAQ